MVRAFFAITLDDEVKQELLREISRLKEVLPISIKWVKKHQLHLTLRFLGNITREQVDQIITVINTQELPAFSLEFQQLIAFPHHKPRIIGMGIRLSEELSAIVQLLEEDLNVMGFPPEDRVFLPHITLGRIAKPKKKSLAILQDLPPKPQMVSTITLYESQLSPEGSIYSSLHEFPLKIEALATSV